MVRYTIRRLLIALPTLIAISMVIFAILALAPGDPMGEFAMNPAITAEIRENLRESLGLDEPLIIRYGKWLVAFVQGNMGYSFTSHSPVRELILQRLPTTLQVVGSAYLLSVVLAVPLGIISALKRTTWLDHLVTTLAFVGISLPTFFTGLLFIIIFSVKLGWLPFIYDSTLVVTDWASLVAQLRQALLPVAVLTLFQTAALMRFVRAAMVEQLEQEYVRMARAKGLHERIVITRHMLRNALIPVVTLVALGIPTIFTGAVVTEQVFRVPGIGALLISAIQSNDTPVVMAITCIYAILVVVCNLAADIVYGLLDPRIRYGGNEW